MVASKNTLNYFIFSSIVVKVPAWLRYIINELLFYVYVLQYNFFPLFTHPRFCLLLQRKALGDARCSLRWYPSSHVH